MYAPQIQAQQSDISVSQLRAIQTRKFSNVDMPKLTNAIEVASQTYGLTTVCTQYKTEGLMWCDANKVAGVYTGNIPNVSFLLRADTKQKATYLRVAYVFSPQNLPLAETKDFYGKFFKSMGDILFVESQKFDMQEIN